MSEAVKNAAMDDEIAKVNERIAEEEQKVEQTYSEIGKLYVALHASDYESGFKAMFDVIEQAENAIRACRAEIRDIRGVVCCEKCGSDMPKGNAFCSVCGGALTTEVPVIDRENLVKCDVCGKYVASDTGFCSSCGMPLKPISERTAQSAPAVEEEKPVVSAPTTAPDFDKTMTAPEVFSHMAVVQECAAPVEEEKAFVEADVACAAPVVEIAPVADEPTVMDIPVAPVVQDMPAMPVMPVVQPVIDDFEATVAMPRPTAPKAPAVQDVDATVAAVAPPASNTCAGCGASLRPGVQFCTSCGQRVAAAPAPAAKKVCPKCGKEISSNAKFCIGCGSRVD